MAFDPNEPIWGDNPKLDQRAGSVSKAQLQVIGCAARQRGLDHDAVCSAAGVDSWKELSRARASTLIKRLTGEGLKNPPGHPPAPQKRRREPGVIRLITPDQIGQITRLGLECFNDDSAWFYGWLEQNFQVRRVRDLATAKRAGQVLHVLQTMIERKSRHQAGGNPPLADKARGTSAEPSARGG